MKSDMFTVLAGGLLGILVIAAILGGVMKMVGMGGLLIFLIAVFVVYKFFH